jgi:hypothetical protein
MGRYIRNLLLLCAAIISGCALPRTYYAPTAIGGTSMPSYEPACPRQLDWIRLSDSGATLDIYASREANNLGVMLSVNSFKSDAPTVRLDLGKVALQNVTEGARHFPFATHQVDFRKSPTSWPIAPLLGTKGGYYSFRYSGIEDINTEKFVLEFPEVSIEGRAVKLPNVTFQKRFGTACESGK